MLRVDRLRAPALADLGLLLADLRQQRGHFLAVGPSARRSRVEFGGELSVELGRCRRFVSHGENETG
jgi:hypothetical protein